MIKKTTVIILSIFLFCTTAHAGDGALNNLKAINVNVNIHDRMGKGLNKTSVKADILKHAKAAFAENFKRGGGLRITPSASTTIVIKIVIDGNKQRKEYKVTADATLKRGGAEWHKQAIGYWDKEKHKTSIKAAKDAVEEAEKDLEGEQLYHRETGAYSAWVQYETKRDVDDAEKDLGKAEKRLSEEKKKRNVIYTIKQTLTNIASGFYGDYLQAN